MKNLIIGFSLLASLSACSKPIIKDNQSIKSPEIAPWQIVRECPDGTTIYKLETGQYAIWIDPSETAEGHWDALVDGVSPEAFCSTVPSK